MILYDKEISLMTQKENINPQLPNIVYEKYIILEILQSLNSIWAQKNKIK